MKSKKIISILIATAIFSSLISISSVSAGGAGEGAMNGDKVQAKVQEHVENANMGDEEKEMLKNEARVMIKDGEGNGMSSENPGSGMNNMSATGVLKSEKGQAMATSAKMRKEEVKEKVGAKNVNKLDGAVNKFEEKFERKTKQEKLNQYQALSEKIDRVQTKFENSDISEAKKEAYRNLFEYVRTLTEEKIASLELEENTSTGTEVE